MKLPKTVSVWFMILFFLFAGLSAFGVSLGGTHLGNPDWHLCPRRGCLPFPGQITRLKISKSLPGFHGEAFF